MFSKVYHATHPDMMTGMSQADLRDHYLISDLFAPDALRLNYLHQERLVIGGAAPVSQPVSLPTQTEPASQVGKAFLDRREMGVLNVGKGAGRITVDGVTFALGPMDGLYVSMGAQDVVFESLSPETPAKFYLASTPAHRAFETKALPIAQTTPMVRGSLDGANARSIHQIIVPQTCASAQLLMGLTIMEAGSVWNTMPPHIHDRRSEAYFYFDFGDNDRIFHFMGPPDGLRHLVVQNDEAVICPPWSVHTGVGTQKYAFIWAMGGDNLDYDDMDQIDICHLR
jgi:4-deoxy-L-threo-5-hexosulose-uronate ketol-isomerase